MKILVEVAQNDRREDVDAIIRKISKLGVKVRVTNQKLQAAADIKVWLETQLAKQQTETKDPKWPFV
ncbi:MAG: hypothetical protein PHW60_01745 [Kiritimatiellae bacterium]|nr:hypothetical protein [Kiritimatiellia bacterium]